MPLTLKQAQTLIAAAHEHAEQMKIKVAVAVVDEAGQLQALGRMDGSFPLASQIAESKAVGAAVWHRDGGALAALNAERPDFFKQVDRLVRMPMIPGLGSALIRKDGVILGAVGVSGARSDEDLECAEAGLKAILD